MFPDFLELSPVNMSLACQQKHSKSGGGMHKGTENLIFANSRAAYGKKESKQVISLPSFLTSVLEKPIRVLKTIWPGAVYLISSHSQEKVNKSVLHLSLLFPSRLAWGGNLFFHSQKILKSHH